MQAENALKWSADQQDDKMVLRLGGELSRSTLRPLWNLWAEEAQRASFLSATDIAERDVIWDLAQITRIDSAGFALLCIFIDYCRKNQRADKTLVLENAPSQLLTLADLFNLSAWLEPFIK